MSLKQLVQSTMNSQRNTKDYNAKMCLINSAMVKVDPTHLDRSAMTPLRVHPSIAVMRRELFHLQQLNTEVRQHKLRALYKTDLLSEDKELREVGLAFYNTQQ